MTNQEIKYLAGILKFYHPTVSKKQALKIILRWEKRYSYEKIRNALVTGVLV